MAFKRKLKMFLETKMGKKRNKELLKRNKQRLKCLRKGMSCKKIGWFLSS